ncbi:MAG: hypothetical protein C0502_00390 [Opitutus sp.]|nr:hypothetical protein [Opitutus sp.]
MPTTPRPAGLLPAIFVTHRAYLAEGGGGAQWCTREYRRTLQSAGFALEDVVFASRRDLLARLRAKIRPSPEGELHSGAIARAVATRVAEIGARWCFLNNSDAGLLAPRIRALRPELRLVFLSHGVELTDAVNNLRLAPESLPAARRGPGFLSRLLRAEIRQRQALDASVCIAEPDERLEDWLGAPRTLFLPRQVPVDELPHAPLAGRVGCVATLDHGPNRDGLEQLASALTRHSGVTLRLVGGPLSAGRDLARRHPAIDYRGRLDDAALRAEAATWCAFANPIFCAARGASTKVATALGWGLPVFTTPQGARGYRWPAGTLPLAGSAAELAALLAAAATAKDSSDWRARAAAVRATAPTAEESADQLRAFLQSLPS